MRLEPQVVTIRSVEVVIKFDALQPPSGVLRVDQRDQSNSDTPFDGWLSLLRLLEAALGEDAAIAD